MPVSRNLAPNGARPAAPATDALPLRLHHRYPPLMETATIPRNQLIPGPHSLDGINFFVGPVVQTTTWARGGRELFPTGEKFVL